MRSVASREGCEHRYDVKPRNGRIRPVDELICSASYVEAQLFGVLNPTSEFNPFLVGEQLDLESLRQRHHRTVHECPAHPCAVTVRACADGYPTGCWTQTEPYPAVKEVNRSGPGCVRCGRPSLRGCSEDLHRSTRSNTSSAARGRVTPASNVPRKDAPTTWLRRRFPQGSGVELARSARWR